MNSTFFKYLSHRVRNENALSDLTWAFAKSNSHFASLILEFMFSSYKKNEKVTDIIREYSRNGSRPDFYIKTNKKVYLIENKIYDRNQHFDQYSKEFKNVELGFIANYQAPSVNGWEIKTWRMFSSFLKSHETSHLQTQDDIKSYLEYIDGVCQIIKMKKMDLKSISSLNFLNNTINQILNDLPFLDEVIFDNKVKNIDDNRYGKYYGISKIGSDVTIWPWIGIYFSVERTYIYIEINEDWCEKGYNKIAHMEEEDKTTPGHYFDKPYWDEDYRTSYSLELKEGFFNDFNELNSPDEQKTLLANYITEVLKLIDSTY